VRVLGNCGFRRATLVVASCGDLDWCPGTKVMPQIAQSKGDEAKGGEKATNTNLKNFNFFFLNFFSHRLYFCLHGKLWFIPFGFVMTYL